MVVKKKTKKEMKREKEEKELKIYKGQYFVAGKNKQKAEVLAGQVSDSEDKIVLLHPKQKTTLAAARRSVTRDRKPLRITPKRPKLRR